MFQESKDELALILFGADETNNDLADEQNYQNINLVFSLSPANWHLFEEIQKIKPGNNPADCKSMENLAFRFKIKDVLSSG
jgi:hypothetical protein